MRSPYFTTQEAAAYLRLSVRTLEDLRYKGGGPRFLALGRRRIYRQADLDSWADERACASTSDPAAVGAQSMAVA